MPAPCTAAPPAPPSTGGMATCPTHCSGLAMTGATSAAQSTSDSLASAAVNTALVVTLLFNTQAGPKAGWSSARKTFQAGTLHAAKPPGACVPRGVGAGWQVGLYACARRQAQPAIERAHAGLPCARANHQTAARQRTRPASAASAASQIKRRGPSQPVPATDCRTLQTPNPPAPASTRCLPKVPVHETISNSKWGEGLRGSTAISWADGLPATGQTISTAATIGRPWQDEPENCAAMSGVLRACEKIR